MQKINIKVILSIASLIVISALIAEIISYFAKTKESNKQNEYNTNQSFKPENRIRYVDTINILEQLNFQKSHYDYQNAYLELVNEINSAQGKVDTRNKSSTISKYKIKINDYRKNLNKLEEFKKNTKMRCFSIMKSVVKAILYYEQKTGNKITKFDPEFFIKEKLLDTMPLCPSNGSYTIIFKSNKRNIYCTVHGILKQQ